LSDWQASDEYARRYRSNQLIGGIRQILSGLGVEATEASQVIVDVDALVRASAGTESHVTTLETSMRLQTYYSQLKELVGDATGLISGDKTISLDLPE